MEPERVWLLIGIMTVMWLAFASALKVSAIELVLVKMAKGRPPLVAFYILLVVYLVAIAAGPVGFVAVAAYELINRRKERTKK